jgi:hypothetical protein
MTRSYASRLMATAISKSRSDGEHRVLRGGARGRSVLCAHLFGHCVAYTDLGLVLFGGPPREARPKAIETARALDPALVEAHVQLGDALQKNWQWKEAEAEFAAPSTLAPNSAVANAMFTRYQSAEDDSTRLSLPRRRLAALTRWRSVPNTSDGFSSVNSTA